MKGLLLTLLLCLCTGLTKAQELSNVRIVNIDLSQDTLVLDSLSIIPDTWNFNPPISDASYYIDAIDAKLYWLNKPTIDALEMSFRVFPYKFNKRIYNKEFADFTAEQENNFLINSSREANGNVATSNIDFGELSYNGNFSRGVSFGNAQSLNLNSGFNIQMSGMITDNIEVRAAITDNNIPIQPEGNTAQLQEFDKVFIQLKMDEHYLTVGDFDLRSSDTYFMKFQRNLQGASYQGEHDFEQKGKVNGRASVAVSRGKFVINRFQAQEGNQGPYKLTGPNGETFIIVLAGSERVFINGELQKRGANSDYVIDYNVGEIIFTPNRLITQDQRIRIEFEYADRYYFRSLYHIQGGYEREKMSVSVNYFSQQDAKNQPLNQELNDNQEQALVLAGDNISQAFSSGISDAEFDEGAILYEAIDTVINGDPDSIFVYSNNPNAVLYRVAFSFIGKGKASYEPLQSAVNGRVYQYVGEGLGSYDPVQLVVAPQKNQMVSVGLDLKLSKNTLLTNEFAYSMNDANTFSDIDDEDDGGVGVRTGISHKVEIKDSTKVLKLIGNYEFKQDQFIPLERYREVEFSREWNRENEEVRNEHLGLFGVQYNSGDRKGISYQVANYHQQGLYKGYEQQFLSYYKEKQWDIQAKLQWLESKEGNQKGQFIRPNVLVKRSFENWKNWSIALFSSQEINKLKDVITDTLSNTSFQWQEYGFVLASPDTNKNTYQFEYKLRYQQLADEKRFDTPYLKANTFSVKGRVKGQKTHFVDWTLTYRNIQQDTLLNADDDLEHFYLGRVNYNFSAKNGAIRGNSLYEIGAGREQRRQYAYLESPDGQGVYAWEDFNDNGVQEIDEFYVSSFTNENRFLRISISAPEFVPVNATRFNQSLYLQPSSVWAKEKGVKNFIARFSSSTAILLNQKIFASNNVQFGNVVSPVSRNLEDSLLVSNATSIRQVVFFNRSNPKFGLEYNYNYTTNKSLLTGGFERRKLVSNEIKLRWNFTKNFTFNSGFRTGIKENDSDFYFDRRYEYIFNEVRAGLTWLYKQRLRLALEYDYAFKSNPLRTNGGQFSVANQIAFTGKYTWPGKSALQLRFAYTGVGFEEGEFENEQLKFDMLQGFQNGNNYTWSVSYDRNIAKNLQLSIIYDGRKTGIDALVHTGRAQVSAVF